MHAKRRIVSAAVLVAVIGTLTVGCSSGSGNRQKAQRFQAKWAPGYTDVKELDAHSDLAAAGRITRNLGEATDANGVTRTDFEFTVTKQSSNHKGDAADSRTVVIRQTGGKNDISADDTLFQEGERAVLFLQEFEPGKYAVVSGPNGRFTLAGSKVTSAQSSTDGADEGSAVARFNDQTAQFDGTLGQLVSLLAKK